MNNFIRSFEALENTSGLSATSIQQQIQETQEAYFVLERELEASKCLLQEVVELYEEAEDMSSVIYKLKQFLGEQEL